MIMNKKIILGYGLAAGAIAAAFFWIDTYRRKLHTLAEQPMLTNAYLLRELTGEIRQKTAKPSPNTTSLDRIRCFALDNPASLSKVKLTGLRPAYLWLYRSKNFFDPADVGYVLDVSGSGLSDGNLNLTYHGDSKPILEFDSSSSPRELSCELAKLDASTYDGRNRGSIYNVKSFDLPLSQGSLGDLSGEFVAAYEGFDYPASTIHVYQFTETQ